MQNLKPTDLYRYKMPMNDKVMSKTNYARQLFPQLSDSQARARLLDIITTNKNLMYDLIEARWLPRGKFLNQGCIQVLDAFFGIESPLHTA